MQSVNPEHAFHLLTTNLETEKASSKHQLKEATVKVCQSISREETHLMISGSRYQAVIDYKGFVFKY